MNENVWLGYIACMHEIGEKYIKNDSWKTSLEETISKTEV
jgi:hypothetical protein